jgi:hypothetical protein
MGELSEFISNIPDDQFRGVITFILMLPAGWVITLIKNPTIRILYGLILGIIFQFYVYNISMLNVFFAALINLILLKIVPPHKVGRYALIYNFTHNSLIHLYRLFFMYDSWSVEISVIFMMTMCKFSAFAYNFADAHAYNKDNNYIHKNQKNYMISEFTTLEYFSYIYFFSTSICGPFIDFNDYIDFIYLRKNFSKIKSTILPSIIRLLSGFLFYGLYTGLKKFGQPDLIIDEEGKFGSGEKLFYFILSSVHEWKYIGAFCLAEASQIACGIAYNSNVENSIEENNEKNGISPAPTYVSNNFDYWNTVKNVLIFKLQMVYKPSEFFHHWNISVHVYLKKICLS